MAASLNTPMISPSSCNDAGELARQVASILDALDNPGVPEGPTDPTFEVPYRTRVCLITDYTDGIATGVYVDEYYQTKPGLPTIAVPDPTRRRAIGGTVEIVGGVVVGTGTSFPDWSLNGSLIFQVGGIPTVFPVSVYIGPLNISLVDTSINAPAGTSYILRENTGSLEGTGNGTCGYMPNNSDPESLFPTDGTGLDGEDGDPGIAATVTILEPTITLNADQDATVVNTGDSSNAILQFSIPRGADGTGSGIYQKPDMIVRYDGGVSCTILDSFQTSNAAIKPGNPGQSIDVDVGQFATYAQPGQIWAASYSAAEGAYTLTHELIQAKMLLVKPDAPVIPTDPTFDSSNFQVINGRLPYDSNHDPIGTITVTNKGLVAATDEEWVVVYHDRTVGDVDAPSLEVVQWSTHPEPNFLEVVVITDVISGAVVEVGTLELAAGTGFGTLMVQDVVELFTYVDAGVPAVSLLNLSATGVKATPENPVALACSLQPNGKYLICSVMDFQGAPGYEPGQEQIWVHGINDPDNAFKMVRFCYEARYVTAVGVSVETVDAAAALYYSRVQIDDLTNCDEEDVTIIEIGDCSTPAAAATAGTSWDNTGFWQ